LDINFTAPPLAEKKAAASLSNFSVRGATLRIFSVSGAALSQEVPTVIECPISLLSEHSIFSVGFNGIFTPGTGIENEKSQKRNPERVSEVYVREPSLLYYFKLVFFYVGLVL
jgi:hypothetical protein